MVNNFICKDCGPSLIDNNNNNNNNNQMFIQGNHQASGKVLLGSWLLKMCW